MRQQKLMRRWGRHGLLVIGLVLMGTTAGLGILQLLGNKHEVVPGQFYRSAQLGPAELQSYVQAHHIHTVLNLRGDNTGAPWYDDELAASKALGVEHLDFRMSASHVLKKDEALSLIALMRDAPKPLLIHCRSGADRTGLASALYVAAIAKQAEWRAEKQLWITYGHIPLWFIGAYAMNDTFESLEPYLGFQDS